MGVSTTQNILVAVLNWGLGHATRMVPVIDRLIESHAHVVIASSGSAGRLLCQRYPQLHYYELADYKVRYARGWLMGIAMAKNAHTIARAIRMENRKVAEIHERENLDIIIADNRYGCHLPNTTNILVTHQVRPRAPAGFNMFQPVINRQVQQYINRFDECWIPDVPSQNLSGQLSDPSQLKIPAKYIGWLSRFSQKLPRHGNKDYDWLAILSGPEPQRSYLQTKFIHNCVRKGQKGAVLAGKPGATNNTIDGIPIIPHLADEEMLQLISRSRHVLMRPGYSSLMDFVTISQPALLVPTPGQTEQQYLAKCVKRWPQFSVQSQRKLDLEKAKGLQSFEAPIPTGRNMLEAAISQLTGR
jgi:hypothetical protein